ncbi:MAG: substrate-binding domain-containing protein [Trueperaceae bacterium]
MSVLLPAALWLLMWQGEATGQQIRVDGSSTVHPLLRAVAEALGPGADGTVLSLRFSGTGVGFELFCSGQVEMIGASRPATGEETAACAAADVEFIALTLAYDWITVVVNARNEWLTCLRLNELGRLWAEGSTVDRWSDLRQNWPNEEIALFAPGVASGTYDVFADRVLGGGALRTDFFPSEDDALLAHRVAAEENGVAFFGHAYYRNGPGGLRALAIDEGDGCVVPRLEAGVPSGHDAPVLLRRLQLYVSTAAISEEPLVVEFVEMLLSPRGRELMREIGYLPLDELAYRDELARLEGIGAP